MIQAEQFLRDHALRLKRVDSPQATDHPDSHDELPQEIRDAAKRGWQIFPILSGTLLASNADALADTATCDLSILEGFPSTYPGCRFGLRTGPNSAVWVVEMREPRAASVLYRLAGTCPENVEQEWDGLTLLSRGSGSTYAFFQWPPDALSMIRLGTESDSCLVLHGDCSWVPLPPSSFKGSSYIYLNRAAVSMTPAFLSDLLFEYPAINPATVEPQQYSTRPVNSGSSRPLQRSGVVS
ncbi:MAG: bifunctional DNA primase/polymerase, partial [Terracidiphilus sp.]